jgi:hypothetical protein
MLLTFWHVPVPLQVRAGVSVDPVHADATHTVPVMCSRQAPAPLQLPSLPHVIAAVGPQWSSGSWPACTLVHVPSVPASAQERQVVSHAVAQQTFCAQTLLVQSPLAVHEAPLGRLVHAPFEQMLGDTQCASAVQSVRQAPVPHW